MRRSVKTLAEFIYAPGRALDRKFRAADLIGSALLALIASVVYSSKATGLYVEMRYLLGPTGHWDQNSVRFLSAAVLSTLLGQMARLLTLAGLFLPSAVLMANNLSAQRPFVSAMREHYVQLLSAALYAWAAARLLLLVPAMVLFQSASSGYDVALDLAPLPYFGFLMILILGRTFRLNVARSLVVLSVALLLLVLTPRVGGSIARGVGQVRDFLRALGLKG